MVLYICELINRMLFKTESRYIKVNGYTFRGWLGVGWVGGGGGQGAESAISFCLLF